MHITIISKLLITEIILPETIAYILMASEMLQKLDLTESTLGKYSLTKDIRYFLYSNTLSRLCITRSAMPSQE